MSENPKEPVLDFEEEIKLLEEKLQAKYPLICNDTIYHAIKAFVKAQEVSKWFDRIAGSNGTGGTGTAGGSSLTKSP